MSTGSKITDATVEMGRKFNEVRLARELSGEAFGATIKMSRSAISQIETGARNPSKAVVVLMRQVHNVSPLWWETGEGPMFRDEEDARMREEKAYAAKFDQASRDDRIKREARAEMEKEKRDPEIDHLKALFAKIKLVLPDSSSLIEKNDVVSKLLRDLREAEGNSNDH